MQEKSLYCSRCRTTENLMPKPYSHGRGGRGDYYYCNTCNTARLRKYRQTRQGQERTQAANMHYMSKDVDKKKQRAWSIASTLPSSPCEVCGETKTDKHHPDYNRPKDVMYLCRVHHKEWHRLHKSING